jgi:hypothetical protein
MNNQVPVLLVIFNRPKKARRVIESLRQVRPTQVFIGADGPRHNRPDEEEQCQLARQVAADIDWPCDVKTRFLDKNVGCGLGVSSAITWFFEHVEYGIILEDDCVSHPSFFQFCSELLDRYKDDERIMQISGLAPYPLRTHPYDYHFSRAFRCWGWGTWRHAWKHFSLSLEKYNDREALELLKAYYPYYTELHLKYSEFCEYKKGITHNWDFQWNIACYAQNGLCIVPERNQITNIGFDDDATHTSRTNPVFDNLEVHPINFPLRHPRYVYADGQPERSLEKAIHSNLPLKSRWAHRLRHTLGTLATFFETKP